MIRTLTAKAVILSSVLALGACGMFGQDDEAVVTGAGGAPAQTPVATVDAERLNQVARQAEQAAQRAEAAAARAEQMAQRGERTFQQGLRK